MEADARRTRIAVAAAFAAQGLGFAVLLTHLPAFKDKYDVGDAVVTGHHLRGRASWPAPAPRSRTGWPAAAAAALALRAAPG